VWKGREADLRLAEGEESFLKRRSSSICPTRRL